jgi:hypothetical protein
MSTTRSKAALIRTKQKHTDLLQFKQAVLAIIDAVQSDTYNTLTSAGYALDVVAKRVCEMED